MRKDALEILGLLGCRAYNLIAFTQEAEGLGQGEWYIPVSLSPLFVSDIRKS